MSQENSTKEENVFKGNEVMMMLEQMNNGISIIAEGQQDLKKRHDELRTELKEEIQGVKTELKEEIQGVRTELKDEIQEFRTEVNEKFDTVFEFLSSIEDEMVDLRNEIDLLKNADVVNTEITSDLNKRMIKLERQFEAMHSERVVG